MNFETRITKRGRKKQNGITVYVGRPSTLGNPFAIGRDGSRAEVIEKYRAWLWQKMQEKGAVLNELYRLLGLGAVHGALNLECWCAPKPCHAEVIKRAMEFIDRTDYGKEQSK